MIYQECKKKTGKNTDFFWWNPTKNYFAKRISHHYLDHKKRLPLPFECTTINIIIVDCLWKIRSYCVVVALGIRIPVSSIYLPFSQNHARVVNERHLKYLKPFMLCMSDETIMHRPTVRWWSTTLGCEP